MVRKLIDRLRGSGQVHDDNDVLVGDVTYSLEVYQEYIEVRSGEGTEYLEGLKNIRGHVQGLDNERLLLSGALTLRLSDGRQLRFKIAGQDGRITALGGIENAS